MAADYSEMSFVGLLRLHEDWVEKLKELVELRRICFPLNHFVGHVGTDVIIAGISEENVKKMIRAWGICGPYADKSKLKIWHDDFVQHYLNREQLKDNLQPAYEEVNEKISDIMVTIKQIHAELKKRYNASVNALQQDELADQTIKLVYQSQIGADFFWKIIMGDSLDAIEQKITEE